MTIEIKYTTFLNANKANFRKTAFLREYQIAQYIESQ